MRTWFHRNPNVVVVLLCLWYAWLAFRLAQHFADERWGWFAADVGVLLYVHSLISRWWRRT